MSDVFGKALQNLKTPITADTGIINWGGIVTGAIQLAVSYSQPINRRRTIGNKDAVIYAGQPMGQINISRLLTTDATTLFSAPGWNACNPGNISVSFSSNCGGGGGGLNLTAIGCVVTTFNIQAEAEGLTVMDNVVIEFLQLMAS